MKWFPDWFNDIGFILTIAGLAFTLWQIMEVGRRQEAIAQAISGTVRRITKADHLVNFTKCHGLIVEFKSLILDKNYQAIDERMPEVKLALDSCRKLYPQESQFILQLLTALTTSQKNLNNLILNRDNYFDAEAFLATIDGVIDIFGMAIENCKYDE
jgi:hypothetical protein